MQTTLPPPLVTNPYNFLPFKVIEKTSPDAAGINSFLTDANLFPRGTPNSSVRSEVSMDSSFILMLVGRVAAATGSEYQLSTWKELSPIES